MGQDCIIDRQTTLGIFFLQERGYTYTYSYLSIIISMKLLNPRLVFQPIRIYTSL